MTAVADAACNALAARREIRCRAPSPRDRVRCGGAAQGRSAGRRSRSPSIAGAGTDVANESGMDTLRTATLLLAIVLTGCTTTPVASPTPEPAALPAAPIAPDQRVVGYPPGRWLLHRVGTTASPYAGS